jgi:hypothetical protein
LTRLRVPELWSPERLDSDRTKSIEMFVNRRMQEGDADYLRLFSESAAMTEELLTLSGDLLRVVESEALLERLDVVRDVGRFVLGPPVSDDDFETFLKTFLDVSSLRWADLKTRKQALVLIGKLIDKRRFPWCIDQRKPSAGERRAAVVATASLRAVERVRTGQRSAEKERQESLVAVRLKGIGLSQVTTTVRDMDRDLPPGSFRRSVKFAGEQCDILVRLFDGRHLAVECKSSNSAVNSIKRLNDVFKKQKVWERERGRRVVTAAVVAGVFSLKSLMAAQGENELYLFWEHELEPLSAYVLGTKHPA